MTLWRPTPRKTSTSICIDVCTRERGRQREKRYLYKDAGCQKRPCGPCTLLLYYSYKKATTLKQNHTTSYEILHTTKHKHRCIHTSYTRRKNTNLTHAHTQFNSDNMVHKKHKKKHKSREYKLHRTIQLMANKSK